MTAPMARKPKRVFILGGGAALGAHHVGALKFLEEQGLQPDAIIASSIGVINACAYASGGVPQLENAWRDFSSLPRIVSPSIRRVIVSSVATPHPLGSVVGATIEP